MTLETTTANETVYYTNPADNIDLSNVKMYWDYDPTTGELGVETHNNSKVYSDAGEHYLVLISDNDLKFPNNHTWYTGSYTDISNHLIEISKYENYKPILVNKNAVDYFYDYKKLQKIVTGIFDPTVTDFDNCFVNCSSLSSIPAGLFDNNEAATNFSSCFSGCSSLISIPEHLFDNNTAVTTFNNCFRNCSSLTSIPEHLFDNNTAATNFAGCFSGCSSLASIPVGLFDNNTDVYSFSDCFRNCSSLTSIPAGLFDNNEAVTRFESCFSGCSSLASIPAGLFDNNTHVKDFSACFSGCSSLASIPEHLFDNNEAVTKFGDWYRRLFREVFIVDFNS